MDAFSASHRGDCTTEGVAHALPAYAGFLIAREVEALERVKSAPEKPYVLVLGGAKVSDKIGVIEHMLDKADTILIGGGYDKGSSYDEWIESFGGKVRALVLVGQTKEKIAECARKHGFTEIYLCDTFRETFDKCVSLARPGDAVLLSPACASWGMFSNYEERGRISRNTYALSCDCKCHLTGSASFMTGRQAHGISACCE